MGKAIAAAMVEEEERKREAKRAADKARTNAARVAAKAKARQHDDFIETVTAVRKVKSDMELLDAVIQKGMETLHQMEHMSPQVAIKAIELKHKMTGGTHNGLTMYGLEEIRIREAAREASMTTVILKYIPEDQHEAVLEEMETITKAYYDSIGLGEAYVNQTEVYAEIAAEEARYAEEEEDEEVS